MGAIISRVFDKNYDFGLNGVSIGSYRGGLLDARKSNIQLSIPFFLA